jgi:hypothetical protein
MMWEALTLHSIEFHSLSISAIVVPLHHNQNVICAPSLEDLLLQEMSHGSVKQAESRGAVLVYKMLQPSW